MGVKPIYTIKDLMVHQWQKSGVAEPIKMALWELDGNTLRHKPGVRLRGIKWLKSKRRR